MKTTAALSKAATGAAAGPFGAVIGTTIRNRHTISKVIIVIIAILLLPVLFIVMLPGLIFGGLTENNEALNSNTLINENIRTANQSIVEVLRESHEDILAEINAAIAKLPEGDTTSINAPYAYSITVNANQLIAQFCASKDNYQDINVNELKRVIRANKNGLFTYDVSTETVTMEVTVEGGAEGESSEETESQTKSWLTGPPCNVLLPNTE